MKRYLWLIFVILLGLFVCAAILVYPTMGNPFIQPTVTPEAKTTPKLVIDPNIGNSPTPAPTEPGIAIPGWGGIRLPAGQDEADVALYNPEENTDWYYLTFELRMKESGEVLFSTGLIPPGMYCTKVTLKRTLDAGTYDGIMHVQPYTMREQPKPTNDANFDIHIVVVRQ